MSALEERVKVEPIAHRFGGQVGCPVGIEEELLLVDPTGRHLQPIAEDVIARAAVPRGRLASEIFAAELELVTPICRSMAQARRALEELGRCVVGTGAHVLGAGLHPLAGVEEPRLSASPRHAKVSEALRGLLRTPPAGLHVHVGMPDPETAIRASNGLRGHLPMLHSLAANSPFWYGRDSGLASARAAILRSYPRYGAPRWFRDWQDFSAVADELAQTAGVADYTYFWWEVRPHPRLGTVEVRAPDAQFSLERTLALAGLIHALAVMEAEGPAPPYQSRDAIEEACYQATRYGLEARLPDKEGGLRPARELVALTAGSALSYARELGCEDAVKEIDRFLIEGNGADVQRGVHRRSGTAGLLQWLVDQRSAP